MTLRFRLAFVGPVAAVLSGISLPIFAGAGELFRYRLRANDGRQFEYVFESSEQPSSRSITREQAIRNATDWMATVHHLQLVIKDSEAIEYLGKQVGCAARLSLELCNNKPAAEAFINLI
jgi:hypothetical protein